METTAPVESQRTTPFHGGKVAVTTLPETAYAGILDGETGGDEGGGGFSGGGGGGLNGGGSSSGGGERGGGGSCADDRGGGGGGGSGGSGGEGATAAVVTTAVPPQMGAPPNPAHHAVLHRFVHTALSASSAVQSAAESLSAQSRRLVLNKVALDRPSSDRNCCRTALGMVPFMRGLESSSSNLRSGVNTRAEQVTT